MDVIAHQAVGQNSQVKFAATVAEHLNVFQPV
jgi:hypothetical protein